MNMSLFVIEATLLYKSSSMLGGLQWMLAWRGLLVSIILDMRHCGDSIYTAELRRLAALASYVSFVIKCFAIHQNMGPAQWANAGWQSAHRKVKRTNSLRSNRINQFNGRWISFGHTQKVWKSRYSDCKFAKEIQIYHSGFKFTYWIDRQNALNWQ